MIQRELRSDLDPANENKDVPSAETGELGFDENYDRAHLTITLGLASRMFDALGIEGADRPSDIRPFPWDKFGLQPPASGSGDVILQICSDDLYVCEHVVRRVEEELAPCSVPPLQSRAQRAQPDAELFRRSAHSSIAGARNHRTFCGQGPSAPRAPMEESPQVIR